MEDAAWQAWPRPVASDGSLLRLGQYCGDILAFAEKFLQISGLARLSRPRAMPAAALWNG